MDDIAKAADVSKGLIYLYFKDKNDVLFYTLRFVLEMYESDVAPTLVSNEKPRAMLNAKTAQWKIGRLFRGCPEACIRERLMVPLTLDVMVYQYIMFCHTW